MELKGWEHWKVLIHFSFDISFFFCASVTMLLAIRRKMLKGSSFIRNWESIWCWAKEFLPNSFDELNLTYRKIDIEKEMWKNIFDLNFQ